MSENRSEVARLLAQIRAEYEAAERALIGMAVVAKHEFINRRMENMNSYRTELAKQVGDAEALRLLIENTLEK